MCSLTMKHTRVVSTKCTPGFACRAFSDTTLVCFIVNEHTTKCSRYIADKLAYTDLPELDIVDDCIECVFAKLHVNGQAYLVGVVYRPQNSNIMDFNSTMHDVLEKGTQYPCYIMGDFNLDLLKHDKHLPTEKNH